MRSNNRIKSVIIWRNPKTRWLPIGLLTYILCGCAVYPLNREYDARILKKDEMSLNVGSALLHRRDKFSDSAATLPKPFVGGFKYGSNVPSFFPYSKYLDNVEVGFGGIPIPFVFVIDLFVKYNPIRLPTHTYISLYSNVYNAQLVSEYVGYSVRGGGIVTQEIFWNDNLNFALSSGILFQKNEFAFYSVVDTQNEPDNITRKSQGVYLPFSGIVYFGNVFIQSSYEYRIREENRYSISIYPDDTKPIKFIDLGQNILTISFGYKFKSPFSD